MSSLALVDYDNVRQLSDKTALDVFLNIDDILDCLTNISHSSPIITEDIDIRIYSGWIDENGNYSQIAHWAFSAVSSLRGLRKGIRLKPHLITCAACLPNDIIRGTVRLSARRARQKMVDTLMTVDALHLADEPISSILIVSDDDDLVPCAIALSQKSMIPCLLLRLRPRGKGINDILLASNGVSIDLLRH